MEKESSSSASVILRRRIKSSFIFHSYVLTRSAMEYACKTLSTVPSNEQSKWLDRICAAVSKMRLERSLLNLDDITNAIDLCENKKASRSEALFNIIDVKLWPRLHYDEKSENVSIKDNRLTAIGQVNDGVELYRNRLRLVLQRVLRSKIVDRNRLSTVDCLLGSSVQVDDIILLGMLTQTGSNEYQVEDLNGSMKVDISAAKFYSGLFTEGCIMLFEGFYRNGVLHALGVGLAPIETSDETRAGIGDHNYFGGESNIAVRKVPRLLDACARNTNASIIIASDVRLDNERVLKGIVEMLSGFSASPPIAFIFCGNFCSVIGSGNKKSLCDAFRNFASSLRKLFTSNVDLVRSQFIFVPGPDDPSVSGFLPRPELPRYVAKIMSEFKNVQFTSNPCRIQYACREILIFRHDIIERMTRNCVHMPSNTLEIAEHFCRTIASVSHLAPLPLNVSPVPWTMDHCLSLYPLPDLVVVADRFQSFSINQHSCLFANPSSFVHSLDFHVYYPAANEIESSRIPAK